MKTMPKGVKRAHKIKEDISKGEDNHTETNAASYIEVYSRFRERTPKFYKDTLRPPSIVKNLEIVHSPVPSHIKPILSAAQRSARELSKKARRYKKSRKNVQFIIRPIRVVDITPRPEKKAGVVVMPESPPFPYSRTTFFNLLVKKNLVDANHSKRKQYVNGDAGLVDLGICPDVIEKMRHYAETENYKDNFETEDEKFETVVSKFAHESVNVQKVTRNGRKRQTAKVKEKNSKLEPTILNVNDENACSEQMAFRSSDIEQSNSLITSASLCSTVGKMGKSRHVRVRSKTKKVADANILKVAAVQSLPIGKNGKSEIGMNEITVIDDDEDTSAPSTSKAATAIDPVIISNSWQDGHGKLIFKENDSVPFSSLCHIGANETCLNDINIPFLVKSAVENDWHIHSSTYFSAKLSCRYKKKRTGRCKNEHLKKFASHSIEPRPIIEPLFYEQSIDDWCALLRPRVSVQCLGNVTVVSKVRGWLLLWKRRLENQSQVEKKLKGKAEVQRRCRTRRSSESDDEYVTEDQIELCNTLVICGPTGCGKTAMIEAVAEELSMAVMVSATNEKRSGANLRTKFEGALKSHRFEVSAYDIRKMLSQKTSKCTDNMVKSAGRRLCTIIVIDDVDVCLESSNSFWSSLKSLCEAARIPVILTCEDGKYVEDILKKDPKLNYIFLQMNKQSVSEIEQYIHSNFTELFSTTNCSSTLATNIEFLNCNLRASINLVHFFGPTLSDREAIHTDCTLNFLKSVPRNSLFLSSLCSGGEKSELCNSLKKVLVSECPTVTNRTKAAYKCITTIQNDYAGPSFYTLPQISTELLPLMKMMDDLSQEEVSGSRRALHHFDRFETSLDPYESIRRVLHEYRFPSLL